MIQAKSLQTPQYFNMRALTDWEVKETAKGLSDWYNKHHSEVPQGIVDLILADHKEKNVADLEKGEFRPEVYNTVGKYVWSTFKLRALDRVTELPLAKVVYEALTNNNIYIYVTEIHLSVLENLIRQIQLKNIDLNMNYADLIRYCQNELR